MLLQPLGAGGQHAGARRQVLGDTRPSPGCSAAAVTATNTATSSASTWPGATSMTSPPGVDEALALEVRVEPGMHVAVRGLLADEAPHLGLEAGALRGQRPGPSSASR
jgi:hypothetical protein